MPNIEIQIDEYNNAPEGTILVKKSGRFVPTTKEELLVDIYEKLKQFDDLENTFKVFTNYHKHFNKYARSHFQLVFNAFKTKVMEGEIEIESEEILTLDEKVAKGEIAVKDAVDQHPFLKERFEELFSNDKEETVEFPEL